MNNEAEDIEVSFNADQAKIALSKLIKSLLQSNCIQVTQPISFWDVIEQLDETSFNAMKTNVYFADLFRSVAITQKTTQDASLNSLVEIELHMDKETHMINSILSQKSQGSIENRVLERDTFSLPPLNASLDILDLPDRFMKLIKRLRNVSNNTESFKLGPDLSNLLALPVDFIAGLPGVGPSYVSAFKELKALANVSDDIVGSCMQSNNQIDFSCIDTSDFRVCLLGLDSKFIKPLEKYARFHNFDDMATRIDEILSFKRDELSSLSGFGRAAVDGLIEFKALLEDEIKAISSGEINYRKFFSKLIVPKHIEWLPIKQIEQLLLDDIDLFLDGESDEDVDITQKRWGYVEEKETLESIGDSYGLSRERIRQKAAQSNEKFLKCLRLSPETIWKLIEPELDRSLSEKWPDLYSCFSSEKAFYEFLDTLCKQDNLFNYVYPELDKSILNTYFAENGAPLHIDDALEYLYSLKLVNVHNLRNAIHYLALQGVLNIEGEFLWPKLLGKSEASACILVNYPKGLPWLDVAKLVNANAFSRSEIHEGRRDNEAYDNPDYIYLAGKGIYKHTNFLSSDIINLEEIFFQLTKFVGSSGREVFHLNECYSASDFLKRVDYYEIRHFVKHFGEDYGFYFDGKSQSDSVGIERGFKNVTQKDVIIEAMNKREKPYTKPEVANLLKSKSLGHASFYLEGLIEEGRVVQVDRMLYTTPDRAYSSIDVNAYLLAMQDLLVQCGKPVEPSIFKTELNERFSKSYSKYFYSSIARLYAKGQRWERKHSLYSINQIPFKNLKDVVRKVCNLSSLAAENVSALQKHIAITNESASIAIANWRNAPEVEAQHVQDI